MNIIVARYNENIDWVLPFPNVIIYNKGEPLVESEYKKHTVIPLKNVGREGHTFYHYIYENYDQLTDYTVFLQGNPFDHMPNMVDILKQLTADIIMDIDFAFLSKYILKTNLLKCPYHIGNGGILPLNRVFYELFYYYNPDLEFEFGAGNQFIVSKKMIHRNPREFYLKIIQMLEYDNCPIEGYVIERFTYLIFCFPHDKVCNERKVAISYLLHQCSLKYKKEDICHFPFNIFDRGALDTRHIENDCESENKVKQVSFEQFLKESLKRREYSMCYHKDFPQLERYCIPDCFFHSWPSANISSFEEIKTQIIYASCLEPTLSKVGWVGNIYSPFSDVIEHYTRPLLKSYSENHPDLFDIFHVKPDKFILNENRPGYMSIPELVQKYKYLIDIGGNGWSGRLKFLLFSKRPLLIVDRKYVEYFYNDLKPYVHYIPVKEDLSDLVSQTYWMIENNDTCLKMAQHAFDFAIENFVLDKWFDRIYYAYNNILEDTHNELFIDEKLKQQPFYSFGNKLIDYFAKMGIAFAYGNDFQFELPYYLTNKQDIFLLKDLPDKLVINEEIKHKFKNLHLHRVLGEKNEFLRDYASLWELTNNDRLQFWSYVKPIANRLMNQILPSYGIVNKLENYPIIHFRCSDVPFIRHSFYHFQRYAFFTDSLKELSLLGVDLSKVYLMFSLSHDSDSKNNYAANIYIQSLKQFLENHHYVVEIVSQDVASDFLSLFYAPAVISTCSSFSFTAGFFGNGIFITEGHYNEDFASGNVTESSCYAPFIKKGYSVNHSRILDYYHTDAVINILKT